jgi:hypothetical protein
VHFINTISIIVTFSVGCVTPNHAKPKGAKPKKAPTSIINVPKVSQEPSEKSIFTANDSICTPLNSDSKKPPYYLDAASVMLTRMVGQCKSPSGVLGTNSDSKWVALDFPCSSGKGRISIAGKPGEPKKITFDMSVNCPLKKHSPAILQAAAVKAINLDPTATLIAVVPMTVLLTDITQLSILTREAKIDVTGTAKIHSFWAKFTSQKPLDVKLLGRETSWAGDGELIEVSGKIVMTGSKRFLFKAERAVVITDQLQEDWLSRCAAANLLGYCSGIFKN